MPKYTYKGKNIYGEITEGVYESPDSAGVVEMLKSRNFYVLEIKPLIERKDLLDLDNYRKVSTKELMLFCKQFSVVLRAGIPMLHALSMVQKQSESKNMKRIIGDLMKEIQMGSSLTQAVKNHSSKLPQILIYMVEAGEVSGNLDKSLDTLYKHFEKSYNMHKKVKSAMTYPIIVAVVAILVVIFLMAFVVPTFTSMFEQNGTDLPGITKALIAISKFFKVYWLFIIITFVGLLMCLRLYSGSVYGGLRYDRFKLNIPVFGNLQRKTVAARFSRTMATLLSSGVGITEGLEISSKVVGNRFVSENLSAVRRQVIAGKGMYGPLHESGCFPPMLETMVLMGEESGTIEAMLENAASLFEEEVDSAVQRITDMIQPTIIVVLGGIVGFIVAAVALPLFQMY